MKRFVVLLFLIILCIPVFAQDLKIDGEIKTGIFWSQREETNMNTTKTVRLGSEDDAGDNEGRFRINVDYYTDLNVGFKFRLNWESWSQSRIGQNVGIAGYTPAWPYAFAYGNFFDNQMTVSIGKLGASPWGTGGPEMWRDLEEIAAGGLRFEWKPKFISGLNLGFVLNNFNSPREAGNTVELTILEILQESIIGVAYEHENFLFRFAFRFDSDYDQRIREATRDGYDIVYRIEEKILKKYLDGLKLWALGYYEGLGSNYEGGATSDNWFFIEYDKPLFTAQMRFGFKMGENRNELSLKPTFFLHLFDKLISVGGFFTYCQDFGKGKMHPGSPYYYLEAEPQLKVNFSENAYFAVVYNYRLQYMKLFQQHITQGLSHVERKDQWFNVRVGMTF